MTVVVAYTAQDSARSALELASVLSRSTGEPLVVAVVVATPHTSGGADFVDGDYLGPLTEWGQSVLEEARSSLAPDIEATFEVRHASSIPGGLLELAAEIDASAMVLGSSSKGSSAGSRSAASPTGSCTWPRYRCCSPHAAIALDRPHASGGSTSASEDRRVGRTWPWWERGWPTSSVPNCGRCRSRSAPQEALRERRGVGRRPRRRQVGEPHEGRPPGPGGSHGHRTG